MPALSRQRVTPMTMEQVRDLAGRVPPWLHAAVWLAAATGLRQSELTGLTWDRIRQVEGGAVIVVDRQLTHYSPPSWGPPKTDAAVRDVRVGEQTARLLTDHHTQFPGEGLVFAGRLGQPLSRQMMGKAWRAHTTGMSLRDRSGWHDLRHFHASMLIADGHSARAVADRLGHEDPAETLRTYAHLWVDDESRAVATVERTLWTGSLRVVSGPA